MRIPRVYTPQALVSGNTLELDDSCAHYLGKVLRMQTGRPLLLFNGEGGEYHAVIAQADKKRVSVTVGEFVDEQRESALHTHLLIGISRGERFDWVLQKATELGVSEITPLFTERCEVKLSGPRLDKKLEHWRQILVSACEQCQRTRLPQLHSPIKISDWLNEQEAPKPEEVRLVLHHRSDQSLGSYAKPAKVVLAIGPEGGLTEDEIAQCEQQDFAPLTMGPRVLRTETAPITALSVLQFTWGDLG